jgi:hypothetical protein
MNQDFEDADHWAGPLNPSQGSMAPSASNHSSNPFNWGPAQEQVYSVQRLPGEGNFPQIPSGYYAQGHQPMDYAQGHQPLDYAQGHQPGSPAQGHQCSHWIFLKAVSH